MSKDVPTEEQLAEALDELADKLKEESVELPPEYARLIDENFMDLLL